MALGEHLLLLSGSVLLSSAIVLVPYALERPAALSHQFLQAISAGISALVVIWWQTSLSPTSLIPLKLALGLCLLTFALITTAGLLAATTSSRSRAACGVTLALLIAASAPLWLGSAVEYFYFGHAAINSIIAISPVSYLAALADWDYLRGEWFYRHTPFGGLRFDYPSIPMTSLLHLIIGLTCHYIRRPIESYKTTSNNCIKYQPSLSI